MKFYFLLLGTLVIVCVGCVTDGGQVLDTGEYHAPPAAMLDRPGPMVDGPGPGVMPLMAPPPAPSFVTRTTQVRFLNPRGMSVGWLTPGGYAENQITTPGRYNFVQGATYRLKLTHVPGREGVVLYPSLQVHPAHPTTDAYLAHNSVPVEITDADLDQVEANNFVTKVIYLPDPRHQELAIAGVETLVSTRLEPGVDPVAEADRRGTIMAVFRIGNMDLEMPGHPGAPGGVIAPPLAPGEEHDARISQVSHRTIDGAAGHYVPPMPIGGIGAGPVAVPPAMIMGGFSAPGSPAMHPVAGMGPIPSWGMPITGTPIGLPGPPHLPLGKPASLQSHTVRNLSDNEIPKPVDHMLIDVKHEPGLRLPAPVKHVQYEEEHPVYREGELAYPQWSGQGP